MWLNLESHTPNGLLFSCKEERNYDNCRKTEDTQDQVKQNKTKINITYFSSYAEYGFKYICN